MNLCTLALKNVFHKKSRVALAICGVGISIAAFTSLVAVCRSLESAVRITQEKGGVDLVVIERGTEDVFSSTIDASSLASLRKLPFVVAARGMLLDFAEIGNKQYAIVYGWDSRSDLFDGLTIDGDIPRRADEILLGVRIARRLKKRIGDQIRIKGADCTVRGIFQSRDIFEEAGVVMTLDALQDLKKVPGGLTLINVTVDKTPPSDTRRFDRREHVENLRRVVQEALPDVEVKNAGVFVEENTPLMSVMSVSRVISLIALVAAAVTIFNTMAASVLERSHELGIVRSIGWRGSTVFYLVMAESVILGLMGGVAGALLGVGGIKLLAFVPHLRGMTVSFDLPLLAKAIASSLGLSLVAGVYPACKAILLNPLEVLRHG